MPGKVTLLVTAGPIQGKHFEFTAHDTFLFGRSPDCHAQLSATDTSASRHHFILEVNPPAARLRDLGSLNGTHVNGIRHGGRKRHETPEEGARRAGGGGIDLHDGDRIRVGATTFSVSLDSPAVCSDCGRRIEAAERKAAAWIAGTFLCAQCRRHTVSLTGTSRHAAAGPPLPAASLTAPDVRVVGDYELGPLIGRGGAGEVYKARRRRDGRAVALKLLRPSVAVDVDERRSVLREIEVTSRLRHPGIVELLDYGEQAGVFFFAMEHCPKGCVETRVKSEGPLGVEAALALALPAIDGLAFAHRSGIVHRDIKPANVLIDGAGRGKLGDLGLAKSFEQAGLSGMTATGAIAGTLSFMPREQITSFRQLRPASDVWSMAATLYYMLTGKYTRDFPANRDPLAVVLTGRIVPLRDRAPRLPAAMAAVVDRAIAEDPEKRFPDGAGLRDALRGAVS
jgi:eukaryotic-like serine/threonine-protein kinase